MLDGIFEVVSKIGEFLTTAWDFVVGLIQDTLDMIKLVGETVTKLPDYFSWMPDYLLASLLVIFGVVVVYKILGREG